LGAWTVANEVPLTTCLDRGERARWAAVVDIVVSSEAWNVLRGAGGLDTADAATAVRDAVATLLTAGPAADT
jgi:hypothetical protein